MRKLLTLLATAGVLLPVVTPAQTGGEILGAAVIDMTSDIFQCGSGQAPCNLRLRIYSEMDPSDFFGSANPVDGYPRYRALGKYISDPQISGNYPVSNGFFGLNWYTVWDGVVAPDTFDHVGYYGAQSQTINHGELGNPSSPNCLPVSSQTACFMALSDLAGNDLDGFGPAGRVAQEGGLSPIPRPVVSYVNASSMDFTWPQAAAVTIQDNAPHPILGYKLFFVRRPRLDLLGPSQVDLETAATGGQLIDASPGTFIPRTTTSFSLAASDPMLAAFDPATESLAAAIKLVFAHDIVSAHYSAHSFPATFTPAASLVRDFQARLTGARVILSWRVEGLAGVGSFNVLAADRLQGPYHPIQRQDIQVDGARGTFSLVDSLSLRLPVRAAAGSRYYRLEITAVDGTRTQLDPLEVDIRPARRGNGQR